MILVDTPVWVDHLCAGDLQPAALLERSTGAIPPIVAGELACGKPGDRETLSALLRDLPQIVAATDAETVFVLESDRLWGRALATSSPTCAGPCP